MIVVVKKVMLVIKDIGLKTQQVENYDGTYNKRINKKNNHR